MILHPKIQNVKVYLYYISDIFPVIFESKEICYLLEFILVIKYPFFIILYNISEERYSNSY